MRRLRKNRSPFLTIFLALMCVVAAAPCTAAADNLGDIQRAEYWRNLGYSFDPSLMTAGQMDRQVRDIQRAQYWKSQGYNFDPSLMTAGQMDRQVRDIQRAEYWESQGYSFNPSLMTAGQMDRQVRDIQRARHWKSQGYSFDPSLMTAGQMDREVRERRSYETNPARVRQAVLELQRALLQLGHDPGPIDGFFGPSTATAVAAFQRANSLVGDGVPGPATRGALESSLRERAPPAPGSKSLAGERSSGLPSGYILDYKGRPVPRVAENGSYYGETSENTGRPKVVHVRGYYRKDGTYVRGHYRSRPRR